MPPPARHLAKLLADEGVPFLAAYRYKPSGLDKRADWEHTWALQRREDAGEKLDSPIPVPPKYKSADFAKTSYWSHRGKLDVPKERFISYPNAGRDTDSTELLGWAGWDHAEQALALAGADQRPHRRGLGHTPAGAAAGRAARVGAVGAAVAQRDRPRVRRVRRRHRRRGTGLPAGRAPSEHDRPAPAWRPAPTTRGRRARTR